MKTTGKVIGIVSNLVTVQVDGPVAENELCYITLEGTPLLAEVIKVNGDRASVQVFESTRGLKNGDPVEFEGRIRPKTAVLTAGIHRSSGPQEALGIHSHRIGR